MQHREKPCDHSRNDERRDDAEAHLIDIHSSDCAVVGLGRPTVMARGGQMMHVRPANRYTWLRLALLSAVRFSKSVLNTYVDNLRQILSIPSSFQLKNVKHSHQKRTNFSFLLSSHRDGKRRLTMNGLHGEDSGNLGSNCLTASDFPESANEVQTNTG